MSENLTLSRCTRSLVHDDATKKAAPSARRAASVICEPRMTDLGCSFIGTPESQDVLVELQIGICFLTLRVSGRIAIASRSSSPSFLGFASECQARFCRF